MNLSAASLNLIIAGDFERGGAAEVSRRIRLVEVCVHNVIFEVFLNLLRWRRMDLHRKGSSALGSLAVQLLLIQGVLARKC